MRGDLPMSLLKLLDEKGVSRSDYGIGCGSRAYLLLVERLHHAENADAIAVFALRERPDVRIGGAAKSTGDVRRNKRIVRRLKFIIFGADHDGEGCAMAARPCERRPFHDHRILVIDPIVFVHRAARRHVISFSTTAS